MSERATRTRPCTGVQERLTEAFLAHADSSAPDLLHAEGCPDCAALRDDLVALRAGLEAEPEPQLDGTLFARTRSAALRELSSSPGAGRRALPRGFGRELLRLLAAPLAALPVVLAWNVAVLFWGGELLSGIVPPPLLTAAGTAYAVAAAGSVGLLFAALPFLAQHEARRRTLREVTP